MIHDVDSSKEQQGNQLILHLKWTARDPLTPSPACRSRSEVTPEAGWPSALSSS